MGDAEAIAALTGAPAAELLASALATIGAELVEHRVHAVHHRPGDGVSVGYQVTRTGPGGPEQDYLVLSTGGRRRLPDPGPQVAVLHGPLGRVLAWRHPADPGLPALAAASDPDLLAGLLPGEGPVTALGFAGYRPMRRAVVRAERDGRVHWVKVLRPSGRGGAADVLTRLELLAGAGVPVPRVVASTADGLVVLAPLDGVGLLAAITADDARGVELADVAALLDRFPAAVADLPRRPAWSERAEHYALAVAAGGGPAGRAATVARGVRDGLRRADPGPVVPTHGDLHEGQLTVLPGPGGWRPAGMLDVDTAGPGHRVDDLACLLGHLEAIRADEGSGVRRVLARWTAQAEAVVDPAALRPRVAGVLLSLAAGTLPGDPEEAGRRLAAAERRLDRR